MKLKKSISFITLLLLLMTIFSIYSFATNVEFSLRADDNIKPGKAFNIYMSVSCSPEIGVFRAAVYFDSEMLEFKSAELYNKSSNEYLKYNVENNKIILIYMSDTDTDSTVLNDIIKLKFSPKSSECADYIFESEIYEAGDKNSVLLDCKEMPVLFLSVSDNGSTSQGTVKNQASSLDSMSENNYQDSYSEPNDFESNTESNESNLDNNHEYSLSKHDESITMQEDSFGAFAGIAILFVIVSATSYLIGTKKRKK